GSRVTLTQAVWPGTDRRAAAGTFGAVRIAVLASGSGTLLEAILADGIPVSLVVVDRPSRAQEVAEAHGVPAILVERTTFGPDFDRVAYTKDVVAVLEQAEIGLVVMAGFGTVFSEPLYEAFGSRVVNTHPALLPA